MKVIKKITAIMLSIMMVLGMCSVVGADTSASGSGRIDETSGTINIRNAKNGETYKVYRLLNLDSYYYTTNDKEGNYSYTFRTEPENKWKDFFEQNATAKKYFEIVDGKYVTVKEEGKDKGEEIAREALNYATKNGISFDAEQTANSDGTLSFSNLKLGYYLVESTVGSLCSLDTTNPVQEIEDKNEEPTVTKKIIDNNEGEVKLNTANIGETITFQTTIKVAKGAKNYILYDEMDTGLELVEIAGKLVAINNADNEHPDAGEYEVVRNKTGKDGFTLTFKNSYIEKQKVNSNITIQYYAKVTDKAPMDKAMKNDTYLKYGDNQKTEHDTTETYTFTIPVFKYKGNNEGLSGAKFRLYNNAKCEDEDIVGLEKTDENNYTYSSDGSAVLESPTSGKFNINGLKAGTYYLKEIESPAGYNKLDKAIQITVGLDEAKNKHMYEGTNTSNITEVRVLNKSGSLLPSTGGMGTTVFYIAGAFLVLISGVVLIAKKRTDSK